MHWLGMNPVHICAYRDCGHRPSMKRALSETIGHSRSNHYYDVPLHFFSVISTRYPTVLFNFKLISSIAIYIVYTKTIVIAHFK